MLAFFWMITAAASTQDGEDAQLLASMTDPVALSEYHRLSEELEVMAARRIWTGAERTFRALVATGVAPSRRDWLWGAHAARAAGDLWTTRQRLASAPEGETDPEVASWIAEIETDYGRVSLACDRGSQIRLSAEAPPLDPEHRRAIDFAVAQVAQTCVFDGLLPAGTYRFFTHTFRVLPRIQTVSLDLRGARIDRKSRRALQRGLAP